MQSELKSLSKIFTEVVFRIPDYQRGYSWQEKQLKDFWSDIEQLPEGKNHYTGVLTLEPVSQSNYQRWEDDLWIIDAKHYSPMYVVDGQQRLTTAIILLQAILERIPDTELLNFTTKNDIQKKYIFERKGSGISISYIFGYEKDNPSYEFLKQKIFGETSINHAIAEDTVYTKNLLDAKKFFKERLASIDLPQVEKIFTTLTQRLQFNIFHIEKDLDVFVTFETMNNRGKLLSHLELLKNRLIYLSTKFTAEQDDREHLRKSINESWKSVYHYLGKIKDSTKDDDHFLKTHYIFYFGPQLLEKKKLDPSMEFNLPRHIKIEHQYKDRLLEEVFTPKRLQANGHEPLDIKDVYNYSINIKSFVNHYFHYFNPEDSDWPEQCKSIIQKLNRLSEYGLFLMSLAALIKFGSNHDENSLCELISSIERYGFIAKTKPYFIYGSDFLTKTVELIGGTHTPEEMTKMLNDMSDQLLKNGDFFESIKNVGKEARPGFYGWGQIRYFMYEYELELKKLSKTSRQLLSWSKDPSFEDYDTDHRTIEHILPQRGSDAYWRNQFQDYSIKEKNILKNSLGNLLPVSHAKNASLSNKSFPIKRGSEKKQVGYSYGCLSEIQVSMSPDWNAIQILRRGIYLLEFLERRWNLKIGDTSKKVSLLGLNFVLERENLTLAALASEPFLIPRPPATSNEASSEPE
ncbi:DUF262 domain-containing protein [Pseudomonas mosselii]|uniref:DUF262 domain-containing protein n=1 Tax=Pseudomonas mosselii TaxID=78327 RepID=UPI001F3A20A7|nr:DUF262 domain-containing protein [Pseudomonas mosselii]